MPRRSAPLSSPRRIPAVVNVASGSVDAARQALAVNGGFDVREVQPEAVGPAVRAIVGEGARRVLVAGGDGTIATAAAALLDTRVELAILPGGTLNHFARDMAISTTAGEALALASDGEARTVDVGLVNGRLFINTSSVGAYVRFVGLRERLEQRFGYRLASLFAGIHLLLTARRMAVEVEVDGRTRIFRTAFLFIGVGERELQLPTLGGRIDGGGRGLHVMVVSSRSRARYLALALAALTRGVRAVSRSPYFESILVDRLRIDVRGMSVVAIDGEIVHLSAPLEYALTRDALTVVCPPFGHETGNE